VLALPVLVAIRIARRMPAALEGPAEDER
jgi:hypothetical protein